MEAGHPVIFWLRSLVLSSLQKRNAFRRNLSQS